MSQQITLECRSFKCPTTNGTPYQTVGGKHWLPYFTTELGISLCDSAETTAQTSRRELTALAPTQIKAIHMINENRAALIRAGIRTEKGILPRRQCPPEQYVQVDFFDREHGRWGAHCLFQTLFEAERYAISEGARWIFTDESDAEQWLIAEKED